MHGLASPAVVQARSRIPHLRFLQSMDGRDSGDHGCRCHGEPLTRGRPLPEGIRHDRRGTEHAPDHNRPGGICHQEGAGPAPGEQPAGDPTPDRELLSVLQRGRELLCPQGNKQQHRAESHPRHRQSVQVQQIELGPCNREEGARERRPDRENVRDRRYSGEQQQHLRDQTERLGAVGKEGRADEERLFQGGRDGMDQEGGAGHNQEGRLGGHRILQEGYQGKSGLQRDLDRAREHVRQPDGIRGGRQEMLFAGIEAQGQAHQALDQGSTATAIRLLAHHKLPFLRHIASQEGAHSGTPFQRGDDRGGAAVRSPGVHLGRCGGKACGRQGCYGVHDKTCGGGQRGFTVHGEAGGPGGRSRPGGWGGPWQVRRREVRDSGGIYHTPAHAARGGARQ